MTEIIVKVQIDLSDTTKDFVQKLFSASPKATNGTSKVLAEQSSDAVAKKAEEAVDKTAVTKKVDKAEKAEPETEDKVTIEELRKLTVSFADTHREVLRAKLKEFNATSVTTLDKKYYSDYYKFLSTLK